MKIVNRVTFEYLKKNKKRTVVTILGVIISVAMLTAISTFTSSFTDFLKRNTINLTGDWQVNYRGVAQKDAGIIVNDDNTAASSFSRFEGFGMLKTTEGEDFPIYMQSYDADAFPMHAVQVESGRLPRNKSEIIISRDMADAMSPPLRTGDAITFPVGKIYDSDGDLFERPYLLTDYTFQPEGEHTYTVTGIFAEEKSAAGIWNAYSYLDISSLGKNELFDITVKVNRLSLSIYDEADTLGGLAAQNGITYNSELLRYCGIVDDTYLLNTFTILTVIVGTIVMAGSILLIYNAFAISIAERGRQLGMLSSVGATQKQKRNSVFFEAVLIGAVAIPLGILSGILGIGITFRLISPLILSTMDGYTLPLNVSVSLPGLFLAIFFSVLTIFISVWLPARRASKISPIDAIRQMQDVKLNGKVVKTARLTRKIFGFEGELALKNLKRNRKRYRSTVFSLTVSILLFLTSASFTHFISEAFSLSQQDIDYNITVTLGNGMEQVDQKVIDQIMNIPGADRAEQTRSVTMQASVPSGLITDEAKEHLLPQEDGSFPLILSIQMLDAKSLKEYAQKTGADYSALQDTARPQAILLNDIKYKEGHNFSTFSLLNIKKGDLLPINPISSEQDTDSTGSLLPFQLTAAAVTGEGTLSVPNGMQEPLRLNFFVSEGVFDQLCKDYFSNLATNQTSVYIHAADSDAVQEKLETVLHKYPNLKSYLYNTTYTMQMQMRLLTIVNVFIYGFVILITLIAVANIFNTVSTSIGLRRREFAMLKSVGMTPKSFNRMMNYESVFYGLKALLYGLPLSLVVMGMIYRALYRNFQFSFSLPWAPIIAVIVGVFLIVGVTMLYSSGKVKKANIIDALTDENL